MSYTNPVPYNNVHTALSVSFVQPFPISDVDVNFEVCRSAPEKFQNEPFNDFPKISRFFPREIVNDLFLARYK